jgi:ribosomal-protein-alanine N-acetyltransferase
MRTGVKADMKRTQLVSASIVHIDELMSWLQDRESVLAWGGLRFRYPFSRESFLEDVYWDRMPTFVLFDVAGAMVGFGQTYEKEGRGHLARLIVSPGQRGKGYGTALVEQLGEKARELFSCSGCSLYVMRGNDVATRCYSKAGFEEAPCPNGDIHFPSQIFMIRRRS